jgi:hypothetical protein
VCLERRMRVVKFRTENGIKRKKTEGYLI